MADSKDDETKFNETLKRMLSTPPKPHAESTKAKGKAVPPKKLGKKSARTSD